MVHKATRNVEVTNFQGLHARPADLFVKMANRYQSKIEIIKEHERLDGKSIWAVLTLGAVQGTKLRIEAEGDDAQEAVDALARLFELEFELNEGNDDAGESEKS